ncbi:uncharacterized protein LOC101857774 [Aplysia californica]|uniref:Uncharacterized protein LOC101857774 n=1 Tax=Aplysia californica TaxID=6500 RepID=A0ABM0JFY1_APLCA|nr:uncharacterized protein LOC101857774 [Aplysia californica]XP_012934889.1 uncharacterized protein LOC101857774 [Aplysia californica]
MSFTLRQTASSGPVCVGLNLVLFVFAIFLVSLPVSRAQDNCGWDRTVSLTKGSNFTLRSPDISITNLSNAEPCQITISMTNYTPISVNSILSIHMYILSFNLSGPGVCGQDSERLEVSITADSTADTDPMIWCGRTYVEKMEYYIQVHFAYFPGTMGRGPGFEILFQDGHTPPMCDGLQQLAVRDEPMLLFSLRTGESFFPNSYQCSWNLTAPEDKVVLLRSARAIAPVCQGPWFHPGENCENVDFQNMNTENSSTELSDDQNGDYGLMGEYVAASKEIIHCENSTSFKKISLTTEERFIQLDSNATR